MEHIISLSFITFYAVGIAGMFSHWAKRWFRQQTKTNLVSYLFKSHPKYTVAAFTSYTTTIFLVVLNGQTDLVSPQALSLAFMTGYGIDSIMNKDIDEGKEHVRARDAC